MIKTLEQKEMYIANVHPDIGTFGEEFNQKITENMIKLAGVPGIFICVPTGNINTNIYNCTLNGLGHCWRPDYLIDYELVKL